MPEFERDTYGAEEAFGEALNHYGIKYAERVPQPEPTTTPKTGPSCALSENTAMPVPERKTVPKTEFRKPVPKPQAAVENPFQDPAPTPKSNKTMSSKFREEGGLTVGLSSVPDQRPTHNPMGLVDPSAAANQTIYRSADGRFDPKTIQDGQSSVHSQATASPRRPTLHRTDSAGSSKSWAERRESFSKAVRRLSNGIKEATGIMMMDRRERRDYQRKRHSGMSDRDSHHSGVSPRNASPTAPIFAANATAGLHEEPASPGKPIPGDLTKGERFAMNVSAAIDPIKRRGTHESDMSFGMTDVAPAGALNACENCFAPTYDYLIGGRCRECHREQKERAGKGKGK